MTVKQPYAVICTRGSRYSAARLYPPTTWEVFKVGRETPQRLYARAEKPERWGVDRFYAKRNVQLARFDTAEAAEAFIAEAKAFMAGEITEHVAALGCLQAAREREHVANTALWASTQAFWAARQTEGA